MKDNIPVGKSRYSSKTNQFHTSWYHSSASFHTGSTQPSRAVIAGGIQEGQFLCIISGYVLFTDLSCIGLMWRWVILFPIVITNGLNSSIEGDLELKTVKEAFSCKDCGETGEHAKTWLMCWGLLQFHFYAYHTRTYPTFSFTNPWRHTDIIMTSSPPMTSSLTYDLTLLHYDITTRTV